MQVNHTMTQLRIERETLRAEVERQDREIERLRADNERLRALVERLEADATPNWMARAHQLMDEVLHLRGALERIAKEDIFDVTMREIASKALEGKDE